MKLNLKEKIPEFDRLPEDMQRSLIRFCVGVIKESFIETSVSDYITARLLADKGMIDGFYWSALQAVEKVLKGIVLLNGFSILKPKNDTYVQKYQHHLIDLYKDCSKFNLLSESSETLTIDPKLIGQMGHNFHGSENVAVKDFLRVLQKYGGASSRYGEASPYYQISHLFFLDKLLESLYGSIDSRIISKNEIVSRAKEVECFKEFQKCNACFCPMESHEYDYEGMFSASIKNTALSLALSKEANTPNKFIYERWVKSHITPNLNSILNAFDKP